MAVELASAKYFDLQDERQQVENEFGTPVSPEPMQQDVPRGARPFKLTAICILCGLFGLWGLLGSAGSLFSAVTGGSAAAQAASVQGRQAQQIVAMQIQLQEDYLIPIMVMGMVQGGIAIALIVSCIGLFRDSPDSRSLTMKTSCAAIVYHFLTFALSYYLLQEAADSMAGILAGGGSRVADRAAGLAVMAGGVGMLINFGISAACYGWMAATMNSAAVKRYFGEPTAV